MMGLFYLWIALIFLKLIMNIPRFFQLKTLYRDYQMWSRGHIEIPISEERAQVIKLFNDAGVKDQIILVQNAGFGYVGQDMASVFENFPNSNASMIQFTLRMFQEAIGVYRTRIVESINPLYWIELVIFLPQRVLRYLSISAESLFGKIAQLLWWATTVVSSLLYAIYKPEIELIVKNFFARFFP